MLAIPVNSPFLRRLVQPWIARKLWIEEGWLSLAECAELRALLRAAPAAPAEVIANSAARVDLLTRRVARVSPPAPASESIAHRLETLRPELAARFGRPLGALTGLQFLIYRQGDFYLAHKDGLEREITLLLALSGPGDAEEEYRGGALALCLAQHRLLRTVGFALRFPPGTLVAFRSRIRHEVKPVLGGERITAAAWFESARL